MDTTIKNDTLNVFPVEYREIVFNYINDLKDLFEKYDVVIFMARKAICFYEALRCAGLISAPKGCEVYSSRILNYNIYDRLVSKRILLVEDVMVRGVSLRRAVEYMSENDISCDVYIMTRNHAEYTEISEGLSVIGSGSEMVKEDVHCFSKYIADFIEANMSPYNIDQPIYILSDDKEKSIYGSCVSKLVRKYNLKNLASDLQRFYGIESYLIDFRQCFSVDDPINSIVDLCKIRFLYNTGTKQLIAVPFVLLDEMSVSQLEDIYKRLSNHNIDHLVKNSNAFIYQENKLKVVHYLLSDCLIKAFISFSKVLGYYRDACYDDYAFGCDITNYCNETNLIRIAEDSIDNTIEYDYEFVFNEYISIAFDYLYSEYVYYDNYYSSYNKLINKEIVILNDLKSVIRRVTKKDINEYVFSHVLDTLIDKGFIIPSIVHKREGTLIRAYKCGEVYALGSEHFNLFAYGLSNYLSIKGMKYLGKTEFEKLCVLFFRNLASNKAIHECWDDCYEGFSICYSRFGPRVSSSQPVYRVDEDSSLAAKLIHLEKMELNGEEDAYSIRGYEKIDNQNWMELADVFFEGMALSYKILFENEYFERSRNMFIISYVEFLTLLAIGRNKKDQLLSLLAELYLFEQIDLNKGLEEVLKNCGSIMNGLVSGMWKYMCYSQEIHPVQKLIDSLSDNNSGKNSDNNSNDARFAQLEIKRIFTAIPSVEKKDMISGLIDKSGQLIFSITYLIWFLQKKHGLIGKNIEERHKREFYYKKMKDIRKCQQDLVDSREAGDCLGILKELQEDARQCIVQYNTHIGVGKMEEKNNTVYNYINNGNGDQIIGNGNNINSPISINDDKAIIKELTEIIEKASEGDREIINQAIKCFQEKNESGLVQTLKKLTGLFNNIPLFSNSKLYSFMKEHGIIK